jgi:phosphatidylglycerol:prolipoprotein diacylglycerol transferase
MIADVSVNFVNLGIKFQELGRSITIFGIEIAYYGIIIAIAMVVGVFMALYEAKRTNQDTGLYVDFALYVLVASIMEQELLGNLEWTLQWRFLEDY